MGTKDLDWSNVVADGERSADQPDQTAEQVAEFGHGPWDGVDLSDLTEKLVEAIKQIPGVDPAVVGVVSSLDTSATIGFGYGSAPISLVWSVIK